MSGSPIIQDGKLVGAVTYVLVNDPTRGTGFLSKICWMRRAKMFDRGSFASVNFIFDVLS